MQWWIRGPTSLKIRTLCLSSAYEKETTDHMGQKRKNVIAITCVVVCLLSMALSAWTLLQRKTADVQVTATDLLSNEAPIRYVNGRPLVDCLVNGNPAVMMIDTGATSILLNEAALVRLHVEKDSDSRTVRAVGGGVPIEVSPLSAFTVAFPSVGISAEVRGANCAKFEGAAYNGLLGSNFLQAVGARIDYKRGVLEFQCKTDMDSKSGSM